jgi:hypothetical protein
LEDNGVDMTLCLDAQAAQSHTQEKRTRFSLSHDDGSIGINVPESTECITKTFFIIYNLEAVSEAASNHSGASSLDIEEDDEGEEDQPDNLSDMVSANVSGRGTPSISGRDTPSSQVTESEEAAGGNQAQQRYFLNKFCTLTHKSDNILIFQSSARKQQAVSTAGRAAGPTGGSVCDAATEAALTNRH